MHVFCRPDYSALFQTTSASTNTSTLITTKSTSKNTNKLQTDNQKDVHLPRHNDNYLEELDRKLDRNLKRHNGRREHVYHASANQTGSDYPINDHTSADHRNNTFRLEEPYWCNHCHKRDVWLSPQQHENVCHSCGDVHSDELGMDTTEFFKDYYQWSHFNFYQAKFHFNERMSQWCGSEPHIPDPDLRVILLACERYDRNISQQETNNTTDPPGDTRLLHKLRTKSDIQRVLRSLGRRFSKKYLEKWISILCRYYRRSIFPCPPSELVQQLRDMFNMVIEPWYKTKPPHRKHLPNYNYLIRQMLYLCGGDYEAVYKDCFPLLNSKKKVETLDKLWAPICDMNVWVYRPLTEQL